MIIFTKIIQQVLIFMFNFRQVFCENIEKVSNNMENLANYLNKDYAFYRETVDSLNDVQKYIISNLIEHTTIDKRWGHLLIS